jgi:hypothetical protein
MSPRPNSSFARLQAAAEKKAQQRELQKVATLIAPASPDARTLAPGDTLEPLDRSGPVVPALEHTNLLSGDSLAPDDILNPEDWQKPLKIKGSSDAKVYMLADGTIPDSRFVRSQTLAQDGHTSSEHQVYQALWRAGGSVESEVGYRDVTIGQTAIARQASISKRNLIRILDSLHEKFSIETLQLQISSDHTAKKYRVWSMKEILNRRRARGYAWIYRSRNVVALAKAANLTPGVKLPPADSLSAAVSLSGGAHVSLSPASGVSLTPPLGSSLASKKETSSSAVEEATPDFDDDVRRQLVTACRKVAPDVTDSEIADFTILKRAQLSRRKGISNLVGLLLTAVPKALEGSGLLRYREAKTLEDQQLAAPARRKDPQYAENIARLEQTLDDPLATAEAKAEAREYLKTLKTG